MLVGCRSLSNPSSMWPLAGSGWVGPTLALTIVIGTGATLTTPATPGGSSCWDP